VLGLENINIMADITNLAETLGLSTQQRPDNSRPFTRAAQQELQITIDERNAEKRAIAEQKKISDQIKKMIKPVVGVDAKANKRIANKYAELLATPNLNLDEINQGNTYFQMEKHASEATKKQIEALKANKVAAPKAVVDAFLSNDDVRLKAVSETHPDWVQYHDDTDRYDLKQIIPKVDAINELQGMFVADDFEKKGAPTNGQQLKVVKPAKLDYVLSIAMNDPTKRANLLVDNEDKVAAIMKANGVTKKDAENAFIVKTINTFAQKQEKYTPPRTPQTFAQKSAYTRDANGTYYSQTGAFTATPIDMKNVNNGELYLETKDKTPMNEQNIEFLNPAKLTEFTDPVNSGEIIVKNIKYKGGNKITITEGEVKDSKGRLSKIPQPIDVSLQQFKSKFGAPLIDEITNDYNNANKGKSKPTGNTITSAEFRKLTPKQRQEFRTSGGKVEG
jgi:hypothetical protein